jgi:hypothetical protein
MSRSVGGGLITQADGPGVGKTQTRQALEAADPAVAPTPARTNRRHVTVVRCSPRSPRDAEIVTDIQRTGHTRIEL